MNSKDYFVAGIALLVILVVWAIGGLMVAGLQLKNVTLCMGILLIAIGFFRKDKKGDSGW